MHLNNSYIFFFFFSSRRRHTRFDCDWSSDVCSSDLRLIRKALEYIPPERLVITTDCGFGREGLSRRIAYYKCVALVEGTNIVRRELGLPQARVRAADPRLWFAAPEQFSSLDVQAARAPL